MSHIYDVEYTDTFKGVANYSWVTRKLVIMPDLTHYGYDGSTNYSKANKIFQRELLRKAKYVVGLTGKRGVVEKIGGDIAFRPYGMAVVLLITYKED